MRAVNKVILNTGILYGRMLLTVGISLFSTRIILNALGSTEFGIFNLLGGVIAVLSILNTAMATSTQRFLSFYQGRGDLDKQKDVFRHSLVIHIGISVLVVGIIELAGPFLFDGFLNISPENIPAARAVYHFMAGSVFFTIMSVPFSGVLIAHENMFWVAFVAVVETLLKLGVALLLMVLERDKLIAYGFFTCCISIISCILSVAFCLRKYDECSFRNLLPVNKRLLKELSSFAGWNLFGSLSGVSRDHGFAILLNIFFGTIVNAAYGIAIQISSQLTFFSTAMIRALVPQIVKSEGAGDRQRMLRLSMMASKFGFFLLVVIAVPCIFEMEAILRFWLHKVPENTQIFCSLLLVSIMINHLTIGLQSALQATGRIRVYQLLVSMIVISNLPVAYFLLKSNLPVYYPLAAFSVVEMVACATRLLLLKKIAGLSIRQFLSRVIGKEVVPVMTICLVCFLVTRYNNILPFRFILTGLSSVCIFPIVVFFAGLCKDEKEMCMRFVETLRGKFLARSTE